MQSVSSRIWTHVAVTISYDDNHYTSKHHGHLRFVILCNMFVRGMKDCMFAAV